MRCVTVKQKVCEMYPALPLLQDLWTWAIHFGFLSLSLLSILLPPHYNLEPILAGTLLYMVIKFYNSISRVLSFRYIGLN